MKSLASGITIIFITLAVPRMTLAGDFSDAFDRVQQVWDNVTSFQAKAWQTVNDTLSSTSTDQVNQITQSFYNNTAPQEVTDASKIALTQLFPGIGTAVDVADKVDQYAGQWASQAQENAQANVDSLNQKFTSMTSQISEYFGGDSGASSEAGNACAIFTGGVCPPCPNGPSDAHGNCPPLDGLESGGTDETYLSQSGGGLHSVGSSLSDNSLAASAPSQATSSITAADLASIGASNTPPPSSSLSTDAQQLPGQLSKWDQQQAAAAAAEAARQAELERQREAAAAQEQAEEARQQTEEARQQTEEEAQAQAATSEQSDVQAQSSGNSWGNVLMQGLGLAGQLLGRRTMRAPAVSQPSCSASDQACLQYLCDRPGATLEPQCRGLLQQLQQAAHR